MRNILNSVDTLGAALRKYLGATKTLADTSPFFGGATHLGWVAADALVIPVRVDQHSMEALKLTLSMLKNPEMDFLRLNAQDRLGQQLLQLGVLVLERLQPTGSDTSSPPYRDFHL
jgi:chromosome partitioning protein